MKDTIIVYIKNTWNWTHVHMDPLLPGKPHIQIKLHDLKDVYDKIQHKKQPSSEQRIAQGKVNGVAWTTCQVEKIRAFVQRTPEAAQKVSKRLLIGEWTFTFILYHIILWVNGINVDLYAFLKSFNFF